MSADRPPLWEVMRKAYDTSPLAPMDADDDWTDRHGYAAEIRAVRDWLVPEELEPKGHQPNGEVSLAWDAWKQRQRLRALLTTEADRAERGDHSTSGKDHD
jgi:hypothetical protein